MKRFIARTMALIVLLSVGAPAIASAVPASGGAAEARKQAVLKRQVARATAVCHKRLDQKVKGAADYFANFRAAHYVEPAPENMKFYEPRTGKVLGGKLGKINRAVPTGGPHQGKVNFVMANKNFSGAVYVANQLTDVNGKPAVDTRVLAAASQDIDNSINSWSTMLDGWSAAFREGAVYNKGAEFGSGFTGQSKSLKSPNSFTLTLNPDQCNNSDGRQNVKFLAERFSILKKATKTGKKHTQRQVKKASAEYKKVARQYNTVLKQNAKEERKKKAREQSRQSKQNTKDWNRQ